MMILMLMIMMNSIMTRFDDDIDIIDDDDFSDEEDDEDDDRTTTRTPNGPPQTPRPRHRKTGRDQTTDGHHRRPIGPPTATVLIQSPGHDVDDDSVRPDNRLDFYSHRPDHRLDPNKDCQPDQSGHHIGRPTRPPMHHQTTTTMMAI